jgi:hypothetical protein
MRQTTRSTSHLAPALGLTLALVLTATAAPPTRPSTRLLDADEVLARARAFLAAGPGAPRPDLGAATFDLLPVEARVGDSPAFDLLRRAPGGRLSLYLRLERTRGRVLAFVQPERDATDATPRARLPRLELLARAQRLAQRLLGRPPGELLDEARLEGGPGTLRLHGFTFATAPGSPDDPGQLQVDLNPETGDVVAARRLAQASSEIEPALEAGTATQGRHAPGRSPPNVGSTR